MEVIVMIAQLVLGLSILIGVHEFGHLIAAKTFGMRVEKFSIGFPPRIWGFKIGETDYSIGAVPLGGFVKITGMIDESLDTKNMKAEPEPFEFRAKPAWQRLIVMMGGIIVNVVIGIIIFVGMLVVYGEKFVPKEEVNKYGLVVGSLGERLGLQNGDKIINISGEDYKYFREIIGSDVLLSSNGYYTVERNGEQIRIDLPSDLLNDFSKRDAVESFAQWDFPFSIHDVAKGSPAQAAGLLANDEIIEVNGTPVATYFQFVAKRDSAFTKDGHMEMVVMRNGNRVPLSLDLDEDGHVGFTSNDLGKKEIIKYSFAEALPKGTYNAFNVIALQARAIGKMIRGDVDPRRSLSGPVGIMKIYGGTWQWASFWRITGLLSMVLAFMNFLPIPALDGGHVMFLLYEMVSGRKPSDSFLETAQKIGMVLLLGLMAFAVLNDFGLFG